MTAKLDRVACGVVGAAPRSDLESQSTGTLAQYARFGQRVRRRYCAETAMLAPGIPSKADYAQMFAQLQGNGTNLGASLRIVRQVLLERLMVLDCQSQATMQQVTLAMTELAEFALDTACRQVLADLDEQHGAPQGPDGRRAELWIIGMGKLGARELNVSSDIDLIYVYDHDGETGGNALERGRISNQEYFGKAVRALFTTDR